MEVREALEKLDHANNDHWTKAGMPSVEAVKEIAGNDEISREDIDAAWPELVRKPQENSEEGAQEKPKEEPKKAAKGKAAKPDGSGRVENMAMLAIERGYANGRRIEVGEPFTYTGIPGKWMVPADDEGKKRLAEVQKAHQKAIDSFTGDKVTLSV